MKHFKLKIFKLLNSVSSFIKQAMNVEKKHSYLILFIISFIFFIIILFPYENIITKKINSMKFSQVKSVFIDNPNFNLFGKQSADALNVLLLSNTEITIKKLTADVSLFKFYFNKKLITDIKSEIFKITFKSSSIEGIFNLTSNLKLDEHNYPLAGTAGLKAENIILHKISLSGFNFNTINIKSIRSEFAIENNNLMIKEFIFSGKDLNGKIRGNVRLNKTFRNSSLDLTIDISSGSAIIKDFEIFISPYVNPDTSTISVAISGTISTPSINLKKSM